MTVGSCCFEDSLCLAFDSLNFMCLTVELFEFKKEKKVILSSLHIGSIWGNPSNLARPFITVPQAFPASAEPEYQTEVKAHVLLRVSIVRRPLVSVLQGTHKQVKTNNSLGTRFTLLPTGPGIHPHHEYRLPLCHNGCGGKANLECHKKSPVSVTFLLVRCSLCFCKPLTVFQSSSKVDSHSFCQFFQCS